MFAVIVLGIGFIMVAAIFPVAISQSRMTVEETTAAGNGRSAFALTQRLAEGGDTAPAGLPNGTQYFGLLPPTDLLTSPPAAVASGTPPAPGANQQIVVPGKVLSFNDSRLSAAPVNYQQNLWNAFKGSLIMPSDNRFAWVALYRRDVTYYNNGTTTTRIPAPFAQVYFIPIAVRNRSLYDNSDLTGLNANLVPRPVQVLITPNPIEPNAYIIKFVVPAVAGPPPMTDSVAEGTFVIISDDKITAPVTDQGRMNGRIYRVGNRRAELDVTGAVNQQAWELAPGADFTADPGADGIFGTADDINTIGAAGTGSSTVTTSDFATAFIIGRNITASGAYEGVSQDVSAFVTFVKVN